MRPGTCPAGGGVGTLTYTPKCASEGLTVCVAVTAMRVEIPHVATGESETQKSA